MKTYTQRFIGIMGFAVIALVFYFYSFSTIHQAHATINVAVHKMTNGAVLCSASVPTLLMATSTTGRNLAFISNQSPLSVMLGMGTAATGTGTLLNASTTLRMDSVGSYDGAIYCEGIGGSATTTYSDSQT